MDYTFATSAAATSVGIVAAAALFFGLQRLYWSPLSSFPGPRLAAVSPLYKAFIECILLRSWHRHLGYLHKIYGPNELHFNNPQAYHDIYNAKNRWDKEESLYHSFGEDRSSFGFLTYHEAKQRKDVLNKSFSARAIGEAEGLVQDKVDSLCDALLRQSKAGKTVDLSYAFRCMTMDIITYYSFGASIDAINAPDFRAPIILAMDASLPVFVRFKHSPAYKNMIINCPPAISRIVSPATAGLVDLQQILGAQLARLLANPAKELELLPHSQNIYHHLLQPSNFPDGQIPSAGSLYEEGQALMFGGADTVGNTLMVLACHLPQHPKLTARLKAELKQVMPNPASSAPPPLRDLEKLPFFNACLKEALRLNSGVISGLPRIVPPAGATIAGNAVPGGTVVSIGSTFVHYNPSLFPDPESFNPDRWLAPAPPSHSSPSPPAPPAPPSPTPPATNATGTNTVTGTGTGTNLGVNSDLESWLVPFSRGPRACLGINLAWTELRLTLATVWRRFDIELVGEPPGVRGKLVFDEAFLPRYRGGHVLGRVEMVRD